MPQYFSAKWLCKVFSKESFKWLWLNISKSPQIIRNSAVQLWDKRQCIYEKILDYPLVIVVMFWFDKERQWFLIVWAGVASLVLMFTLAEGLILSTDNATTARVAAMNNSVAVAVWNWFWWIMILGSILIAVGTTIRFRNGIKRKREEKITLQGLKADIILLREETNARLDKIEKILKIKE
jgi:hypothetical protein